MLTHSMERAEPSTTHRRSVDPRVVGDWANATRAELLKEIERAAHYRVEMEALQAELEVHREELRGQLEQLRFMQQELEASRNAYFELYDEAPVPYLTLDSAGIIAEINLTGCRMLETPRQNALGMRLQRYIDPIHRQLFLDHLRRCGQPGCQVATELRLTTAGGRSIPALLVSQALRSSVVPTILLDRTEHSQLNEMIRQLNSRLVAAQEGERLRIARELHDEMGQRVAALILDLRAVEQLLPAESELRQRLQRSQDMADAIGREVHDLALELRPTALDDLGLEAALEQYLRRWSTRSGIAADFHARGLGHRRFPADVEITMYRLVQEALTNVARHSGATRVGVVLEARGPLLTSIVEDNGKGFDPQQVFQLPNHERLGLIGMRERLDALGGTLEIESRPGHGATVFARVVTEFDGR